MNFAIWGLLFIVIYGGIAILPLTMVYLSHASPGPAFLYILGKNFALVGITLLALQFFLAGRIKRIAQYYGLDMVVRFHKAMGVLGFALLAAHPLLLAAGSQSFGLLLSLQAPWYIWFGKIALLALTAQILISVWQKKILEFQKWRRWHNGLALGILALVFFHSWITGSDLNGWVMRGLWITMFTSAVGVYLWNKIIIPWEGKKHPWRVSRVIEEARGVTTLEMTPSRKTPPPTYAPGQFQFLTLYRGDKRFDGEEHHFTISSSPAVIGSLTFTIKAVGDFTATLGQTKVGDLAQLQGPFGRFSHVFHPHDRNLVMLAGGIGITPLMSMLRSLRDTQSDRQVLLIYNCRTEADLAFRRELEGMAGGRTPQLKIFWMLNDPPAGWPGESGRLDEEKLKRYLTALPGEKAYYVCGPPPMMDAVLHMLRNLGVPAAKIRSERFSF